jgi:hypothetical protein
MVVLATVANQGKVCLVVTEMSLACQRMMSSLCTRSFRGMMCRCHACPIDNTPYFALSLYQDEGQMMHNFQRTPLRIPPPPPLTLTKTSSTDEIKCF